MAGIGKLFGKGKKEEKPSEGTKESNKNEEVKTKAIEEVKSRSKQKFSTIHAFSAVLNSVYNKYTGEGLKTLRAIGNKKSINIVAEASPESNTTLAGEIVTVNVTPEQYKDALNMPFPGQALNTLD